MSDAKVRFFKNDDADPAAPGEEVYFSFACPKFDRRCGVLPIFGRSGLKHDGQNQNGGVAHWGWDGNRDRPTFTPSVNCGHCWHGFIENGRCVSTSKIDEIEPAPRK